MPAERQPKSASGERFGDGVDVTKGNSGGLTHKARVLERADSLQKQMIAPSCKGHRTSTLRARRARTAASVCVRLRHCIGRRAVRNRTQFHRKVGRWLGSRPGLSARLIYLTRYVRDSITVLLAASTRAPGLHRALRWRQWAEAHAERACRGCLAAELTQVADMKFRAYVEPPEPMQGLGVPQRSWRRSVEASGRQ
jgi:hypothetical protein